MYIWDTREHVAAVATKKYQPLESGLVRGRTQHAPPRQSRASGVYVGLSGWMPLALWSRLWRSG